MPTNDLTLTEAKAIFASYCRIRNLSPKTLTWYRFRLGALTRYVEREYPGIRPAQIEIAHLRSFVSDLMDNASTSTTNHTITAVKTFFSFLTDEGYIPENPAARLAKLHGQTTLIRAFTDEQVRALLAAPEKRRFTGVRDYALMVLLLDTGLRISEALNLKLSDVDWTRQTLRVMGKGRKERIVPFGKTARQALREYLDRRGEIEDCDSVFVTEFANPGNLKMAQEAMARYAKQAGISGVRCSPHTFRHTFAKNWITNGGDPFSLQKILGHTTMDMVRRYVNLANEDVERAHLRWSPADRLLSDVPTNGGKGRRKKLR